MRILLLTALLGLAVAPGCDEPFPPYEEPANVLVATLATSGSDTLYIIEDSTGQTLSFDPIRLNVIVRNNYTQLLQGSAQISGKVNVVATAPFGFAFPTYPLSQSDLSYPPVFKNSIALPPGKSAEFHARTVGPILDLLKSNVPYTEIVQPDSTRVITYAPVTFHAVAEVRLFEQVQAISTPQIVFSQTFVQIILHNM